VRRACSEAMQCAHHGRACSEAALSEAAQSEHVALRQGCGRGCKRLLSQGDVASPYTGAKQ